ncbi:hypothetical protein Tco_0976188 [Tanacetum coccineum]|uniref:Uncharacterized protein n=1 Tax=Tanacetum coccineum TaxID=301880 RepID=A0ABQ5EGN4_9ASTR
MKELKKCILNGPYVMTRLLILAKPATKTDPAVPKHTVQETYENTVPKNRAYIDDEAEAIHMILSGIEDEIYSTDVKANLFWEFGKFTSRDGESIESYYSRFYKMMNEMYPNDNYYHAPKPYKNLTASSRHTSSTSSHAPTRTKGKEVAKPRTPPSLSASEEDIDPEQDLRDKDMQKSIALIANYFTKIDKPTNNNIRTSLNSRNKNVGSTPKTRNDGQTVQFRNQRTITVARVRDTVVSYELITLLPTSSALVTPSENSLYGLEVGLIWRIQVLDKAYWGFLGVGTTLDIFQNIIFHTLNTAY